MGSLIYLVCIQLFIFNEAYSQCVNRFVQGPNGPIELVPNQILVPQGVPYLGPTQGQGRPVYIPGPNQPCQPPVVVPSIPPIPEYIPNPPPVLANFAPQSNIIVPNIPSGNFIVPNIPNGNFVIPNIPSVIPNTLPGNFIVPSIPTVIPEVFSGNVVPNIPSGNYIVPNTVSGVVPAAESYAPTVVHDNSVANSLANALQLLVVSNLLSNTLPEPPCYDGFMPGYGYVY